MRDVMWSGQLLGSINLDTIAIKRHLYGLGPSEYLVGELLILDGKSYVSRVQTDTTMTIEESFEIKAPFFVFAHVKRWKTQTLPKDIQTLADLEAYLDQITIDKPRPFAFKLKGLVESASIHIVNLPPGSVVRSPEDAHCTAQSYQLRKQKVVMLGFFSTTDQGIFTHHDTYFHIHLITADKMQMGHLEKLSFGGGKMKLYLPK
jgi:acetolactate decarboxylase